MATSLATRRPRKRPPRPVTDRPVELKAWAAAASLPCHAHRAEAGDAAVAHALAVEREDPRQPLLHRRFGREHEAGHAVLDDFTHGAAIERGDRCTARHRLGEHQSERFTGLDWIEHRPRPAQQVDLLRVPDLADVDDPLAVDVWGHLRVIVLVLRRREQNPQAGALGNLDRLQNAFSVGETAEEQHIVVGLVVERERVCVDAVQDRADDVEAAQEPRLFIRDRDEGRFRIARPEAYFFRARRVVQRLEERHRAQPRESQ